MLSLFFYMKLLDSIMKILFRFIFYKYLENFLIPKRYAPHTVTLPLTAQFPEMP